MALRKQTISFPILKGSDEKTSLPASEPGSVQEANVAPSKAAAATLGNQLVVLDAEQTAIWRETAQPVYDNWAMDMDAKGYDGKALIAEAEALIAKYTAAQ